MKLKRLLYRTKLKRTLPAPSFALFSTCAELPLPKLIRILVDGDLSHLIISGKPGSQELSKTWAVIRLEYISILDLPNVRYTVELGAEICVLETKLYLTDRILITLYIIHDDRLTAMLRGLGFDFPFDPMDRIAYYKSLQAVDEQKGAWALELEQKQAEMREIESKDADGAPITDDYFDDILAILSKSQGYHLKAQDLTASSFAVLLRRHKAKADQQRYENILKTQSY